jgi:fucose permease
MMNEPTAQAKNKQFVILCVILTCIFLLMGLLNEKIDVLEKRVYSIETSHTDTKSNQ